MGANPQIIQADTMDKIPAVEDLKLTHLNKWVTGIEKYTWVKLINWFLSYRQKDPGLFWGLGPLSNIIKSVYWIKIILNKLTELNKAS